jgi:hypothetical protein
MSIFVTGDIHGSHDIGKFADNELLNSGMLTKSDIVVILGDFGLSWSDGDTTQDEYDRRWLKWLSKKPWTTLVIDGNHEAFDRLYALPVVDFMGGRASQIYDSIWWLRRGEVYTIDGCKCFTFGGAYSVDKARRTPGKSWWPQEIPSEEEFQYALQNLERHGWNVDYVFTHNCPESVRQTLPQTDIWMYKGADAVTEMLETIKQKLAFKHWYFGHYHRQTNHPDYPDPDVDARFTALYYDVLPIDGCH